MTNEEIRQKAIAYEGCRNCKYQPEPMQMCDWMKHETIVYMICPRWEKKENRDDEQRNNQAESD